jgi:hypothetical protein
MHFRLDSLFGCRKRSIFVVWVEVVEIGASRGGGGDSRRRHRLISARDFSFTSASALRDLNLAAAKFPDKKFCFFAFLRYVNGFVASRIPFRRFVEVHARRVKCGFGDHLAVTHSPVTSHIALRTNTNSRDEAITLEFDSLSVRLTLHCRLTLCWESGKRKKSAEKRRKN